MCGRFTLTVPPELIGDLFDLDVPLALQPRYNIAPSQPVAVIANHAQRAVELYRWGLIPHWAKDHKIGYKLINARSETLASKPSFRNAYKARRCLILADGFYEWRKQGKARIPFRFALRSAGVFTFAGLWETWRAPDGDEVRSCTIVTTEANAVVGEVHDRMPVILPVEVRDEWLDPERREPATLQELLRPYPAEEMEGYEVSTVVNSPKHETAECVKRVGQVGLDLG